MAYIIIIGGGKEGLSSEDAAALEYGAARLAHELVGRLDSVTHATFGGTHYAHADLRDEPQPPPGTPAAPSEEPGAL